jgi:2-amino-4-hydroxy-6-hydroxymethyldihydropteridine diphosphokinase
VTADVHVVYVGLGSNLGDRQANLQAAVADLAADSELSVLQSASLYTTRAQGEGAGEAFLNTALKIEWCGTPLALLDLCQSVEARHGRVRTYPNAPRTLDIDLLWLESGAVHAPGLEVPHPRLHERAFALVPLLELNPDLVVPDTGQPLSACLNPELLSQGIHSEPALPRWSEHACV